MAPLTQDRPQVFQLDREGIIVGRLFEDGSTRTTIYRPDGTAEIVTRRTNPSTGAEEKLIQESGRCVAARNLTAQR